MKARWHLLFCVDDCLVCRHTRQSSTLSTSFGKLWAHYQEKQLCLCDTWHELFCAYTCDRQTYTQNNKYHVSNKHSCFFWWWTHSCPKHVEIDKYRYTKEKLCTKLVLFTRVNVSNICVIRVLSSQAKGK